MSPERTIGETLRGAREKRGITQEGLSQGTRISLSVIRKLERDRFEELPGGLYTRNFIRIAAEYLELDAEALFARLGGRDPAAAAPAAESGRSRASRDGVDVWREESVTITRFNAPRRRLWPWALALLVVAAAALLWLRPGWIGLESGEKGSVSPAALEDVRGDASENAREVAPNIAPGPAPGGESAPRRSESLSSAVDSFAGPLALAGAAARAEETAAPAPLLLEIEALGECRVTLTVDGKRQVGRRFPRRGGRWTLHGNEYFLLSTTDVGRLRLRLDGEEYAMPAMGREPLVALRIAPSEL